MNSLEKYASKRKLAMGLSNMLMGLAGKLGGHRSMGHSPLGGSFPLSRHPSHSPQPSPCGAQSMMPMHRDDDAKMLSKVLDSTAAQAISLKKKIDMGHKLPSWAEYKVYKAADCMKSATASTFSLRPKITIIIKRIADKNKLAMKKEAVPLPLLAGGAAAAGWLGKKMWGARNPYKAGTVKHKMYGSSTSVPSNAPRSGTVASGPPPARPIVQAVTGGRAQRAIPQLYKKIPTQVGTR